MNERYLRCAERALEAASLEPLRGKSILITGSNGLLGSHMAVTLALANERLGLECRATCVSRSRPSPEVHEILQDAGFAFVQADLIAPSWTQPELGPTASYDYVVHAATYGQPKKFLDDPLGTMRLNSSVTLSLLEMAARANGSFLFMSSSEIYGSSAAPEHLPFKEEFYGTASPIDQRAAYTSSKRFGETLCKVFEEKGLARARIARVSSVYGPGVRLNDDRVLNVFIRRALQTGEIRMMDRGEQTRRWLHVSDALGMLFWILLSSKELVYNVGGTDMRSIAELAAFIGEATGAPVSMPEASAVASHTAGAPPLIDMSVDRILRQANLGQLIPLREGIKDCVDWTKSLLAERPAAAMEL